MQFFNTRTSTQPQVFKNRIQAVNSAYPDLSSIEDPFWHDTIEHAKQVSIEPGTTLFTGTSSCESFMLVLDGTIRVYQTANDGREITLYRVQPGDLCALSLNSLLKNKSINAMALSESHVKALVMNANSFHSILDRSTTFRNYVINTLTERLYEITGLIQDTAFNHLNMRLACMLDRLFKRNKGPLLKITHQEIALELGTTREVISRILKDFERHRCVNLSRGYIELASAESLLWFTQQN